jgi:hypothetical protein
VASKASDQLLHDATQTHVTVEVKSPADACRNACVKDGLSLRLGPVGGTNGVGFASAGDSSAADLDKLVQTITSIGQPDTPGDPTGTVTSVGSGAGGTGGPPASGSGFVCGPEDQSLDPALPGPDGYVRYNSNELSSLAYRARVENTWPLGRNVAVARVPGWNDPQTGDCVYGFSKGDGYHSEDHIMDQLRARGFRLDQIAELYSERSPCRICESKLQNSLAPGTPVTWSVPSGIGSTDALRLFIQMYGNL